MPVDFFQSLEPRQLLAAGTLDPTFGLGGAIAMRVEPDGRMGSIVPLPTGQLLVTSNFNNRLHFSRLNADGNPDPAFSAGGRVPTEFDSDGDHVTVDANGRIAVGGTFGKIGMFN